MWLQPWFFSMRVRHLGHLRVLARIQLAVSDSFRHFSAHVTMSSHVAGTCASSPHLKQKRTPHLQSTARSEEEVEEAEPMATKSQPRPGHQRKAVEMSTKDLRLYLCCVFSGGARRRSAGHSVSHSVSQPINRRSTPSLPPPLARLPLVGGLLVGRHELLEEVLRHHLGALVLRAARQRASHALVHLYHEVFMQTEE